MSVHSEMDLSDELISEAIAWRHHLHQHPELAYQEKDTSNFIAARLADFGLSIHRGLAGTGVVGTISRGSSPRVIGIRADMDALPIAEATGAEYASKTPGAMHACGHDGHVAMALAAARVCAELKNINGTVHFIFQPAEENEGGARRMVEEGLFRLFPCDAVYAIHNWPSLPLGTCAARDDAMMAALATFEIIVQGQGCHGAMPHEGTDSLYAGCQIVSALQSLVSRNVDARQSAVVSVTQFKAGDTWNVIADQALIRGTTRWFDAQVGELLERRLTEVASSIAPALGCTAEVRYERRFPATINCAEEAGRIRDIASSVLNLKVLDVAPSMSSEDFAFMLQATPGCYLWLGGGKASEQTAGLHSPRYDFNDALVPIGAQLWVSLIRQSLAVAECNLNDGIKGGLD